MVIVSLLPLLAGCAPPVEAPTELDELMGFLFEHLDDDDDVALAEGAKNLDTWLVGGISETIEGYSVADLSEVALEGVGYSGLDLDKLGGAAVGHVSTHSQEDLVKAAVSVPANEIYSGYDSFERDYLSDLDCFVGGTCAQLDADVQQVTTYAGLLTVGSHSTVQYRWVETEIGTVQIERTWLVEPAAVSPDGLVSLDAQFFLWATLPVEDGSARGIQCTWVVAEILDGAVSEDTALSLMVSSMSSNQDTLDSYVDEHPQ